MRSHVLETQRLILRPPSLDDLDRWSEMMADPETARNGRHLGADRRAMARRKTSRTVKGAPRSVYRVRRTAVAGEAQMMIATRLCLVSDRSPAPRTTTQRVRVFLVLLGFMGMPP